MPEGYVSPRVAKLIDQQLMAQTGSQLGDLEDWLMTSDRYCRQPDAHAADETENETTFTFDFL